MDANLRLSVMAPCSPAAPLIPKDCGKGVVLGTVMREPVSTCFACFHAFLSGEPTPLTLIHSHYDTECDQKSRAPLPRREVF
jgi:hypothetical protein